MADIILIDLLPSLLVYSSIGSSILMGLPALRRAVKDTLDAKLAEGETSIKELFDLIFFTKLVQITEFVAVAYLVGGFLVLLTPCYQLTEFAYWTLVMAHATLIIHICLVAYRSFMQVLRLKVTIKPALAPIVSTPQT